MVCCTLGALLYVGKLVCAQNTGKIMYLFVNNVHIFHFVNNVHTFFYKECTNSYIYIYILFL